MDAWKLIPQLSESRGYPRFKASKGEVVARYRDEPLATQKMGHYFLEIQQIL